MTTTQAHNHKRAIGAELIERTENMLSQPVWLFYSADGRKLDCKAAK